MAAQRDRAHVPAPAPAADPRADGAAEAGEAARRERLAPDVEEVTERRVRRGDELDDAGRLLRAHRVAATAAGTDPFRQQQHELGREELDVRLLDLSRWVGR